jgi:hypothetical protein
MDRTSVRVLLVACFMLVSCFAYSLILKMEVICFSKMLVNFHQTMQHYIPKVEVLRPAVDFIDFDIVTYIGNTTDRIPNRYVSYKLNFSEAVGCT